MTGKRSRPEVAGRSGEAPPSPRESETGQQAEQPARRPILVPHDSRLGQVRPGARKRTNAADPVRASRSVDRDSPGTAEASASSEVSKESMPVSGTQKLRKAIDAATPPAAAVGALLGAVTAAMNFVHPSPPPTVNIFVPQTHQQFNRQPQLPAAGQSAQPVTGHGQYTGGQVIGYGQPAGTVPMGRTQQIANAWYELSNEWQGFVDKDSANLADAMQMALRIVNLANQRVGNRELTPTFEHHLVQSVLLSITPAQAKELLKEPQDPASAFLNSLIDQIQNWSGPSSPLARYFY